MSGKQAKSVESPFSPPKLAYVELLSTCNANCKHCTVPKNDRVFGVTRNMDQLCEDFQTLRNLGVEAVTLAGGEPTLHPNFVEVVGEAHDKFKKVHVISNGSNPSLLRAITNDAEVWVSLDYMGSSHSIHRGIDGLWQKYLSICNIVNVRCTLFRDNLSDIQQIILYAGLDNKQKITIAPYRGFNLSLCPMPQMIRELFTFIHNYDLQKNVIIDDCSTRQYVANGLGIKKFVGCNAVTGIIRVTYSGMVTPCPFLSTEITSLHDPFLKDKLIDARQDITKINPSKCAVCPYQLTCGGCKASLNSHCIFSSI